MGNIILSAFSDEYAVSFEEQLKGMKELGINNIELRQADGKNVAALTEKEVKRQKQSLMLTAWESPPSVLPSARSNLTAI